MILLSLSLDFRGINKLFGLYFLIFPICDNGKLIILYYHDKQLNNSFIFILYLDMNYKKKTKIIIILYEVLYWNRVL